MTTWVDRDGIILSEICQTNIRFHLYGESKKKNRYGPLDILNNVVVAREEEGEGMGKIRERYKLSRK